MSLARTERAALADLFADVGPDHATLCDGWQTADLLAHLLVRERRPDAAAGLLIPPLRAHLDAVIEATKRRPWAEQLREYAAGPPAWNPMGWGPLDAKINGAEMFIHHEDVRRAAVPDPGPRELPSEVDDELADILRSPAIRLLLRSLDRGLAARLPDGEVILLKKPPHGAAMVTIAGSPGEVLLWVYGRDIAQVDFLGAESDVAAVRAASRGG